MLGACSLFMGVPNPEPQAEPHNALLVQSIPNTIGIVNELMSKGCSACLNPVSIGLEPKSSSAHTLLAAAGDETPGSTAAAQNILRWSQFATDVGSTMPAIIDAISKATGKKIEYEDRAFPAFVAPSEFVSLAATPGDQNALKMKKKAFAANKTSFKADWTYASMGRERHSMPTESLYETAQPSPMPSTEFHPFAGWISYLEYYKQWHVAYIDFQIESLKKVEEQWSDALQASLAPLGAPAFPFAKDLYPSPNPIASAFADVKVKDLMFPFMPHAKGAKDKKSGRHEKSGKRHAHLDSNLVATTEISPEEAKRVQAQQEERSDLKNATAVAARSV